MGVTIHIHPFVASEGPWKPDRPELGGGGRGGRSQHTEMIRGGKGGKERGKERNRSSPGSGSRKCPFSHPISADLSTPGGQGKMKDHLVSQMWFSPSSPALPGLASCRPWGPRPGRRLLRGSGLSSLQPAPTMAQMLLSKTQIWYPLSCKNVAGHHGLHQLSTHHLGELCCPQPRTPLLSLSTFL